VATTWVHVFDIKILLTLTWIKSPPIQPLLISSYEFENNVLDSTGTNHGTVTGNTQFTTGKIGINAFDFDDNTFITLLNENNFDFEKDQQFSVAFWAKFNNLDSNWNTIINKWQSVSPNGWLISQSGVTNGFDIHISNNVAGGDLIHVRVSNILISNTWTHVVATYDGSGQASGVKIYINGVEKPTLILSSILNNIPLRLGAFVDGGAINTMNGQLDQVEIFDKELTATQVSKIFINS